jgi:hypothetical protein
MSLKMVVDSLDGVEAKHHDLYVKGDDGKFRLDAEIEDVSGLKGALEKERKAARDAEAKRKELEDRLKGFDPDEYEALKRAKEDAEDARLRAEGRVDEIATRKAEKVIAEVNQRLADAEAKAAAERQRADRFSQHVLDDQIRAAAAKAGIHANAVDDALFRGRSMFQLDENGRAVHIGDDGKPVRGKDGRTALDPAEWLDNMKKAAPHWFPAGASGSGSGGGTRVGVNPNFYSRSTMTPKAKSEYISRHGRDAYMALPM